jgi:hypothetical protein
MKTRWIALPLLAAGFGLSGCASNSELSQKEKDRLAREMERENQKQAKSQEKMMRGSGSNTGAMGGQRKSR